ncbi:PucR family transcriptional regulator [Streptomyces sp. NPDC020875]|uniref:PucR family transcriptional regulator n=1 Tax=Streptomyces sp. NPDC020875 TaxID=3154898 RepID=UPI0033D15751
MPPTLAALVQHSALKLSVRAGEGRLGREVRWAHVSELADPVPYLEGGELLLVTAITLDVHDPEAMRRYVRRLADAGVVGLGFAVGVHHDDVPEALLDAAREADFPLLAVPRRTPFLAISKAVSAAIAADQYRAVTAGFAAQRELTRAALADGPAGVVTRLAGYVDGWAALYDASGAVVAVSPDWAARRAARYTADVERLREGSAPASAVVADTGGGDDRVELQSLGAGRRVRGTLAVGTGAPLGTAERYAVHSAVALLTLATERSRSLQGAEQRIGAAVLRMLLAGEAGHARTVAGEVYGGLLDAPFRLLIAALAEPADGPSAAVSGEDPLRSLAETLETAAARAAEPVLAVPDEDGRLLVLAADEGAVLAACRAAVAAGPDTDPGPLRIGVSAPGPAAAPGTGPAAGADPEGAAAPTAYHQAEQALSVARRRGRALVEYGDVVAGSVLPLLGDEAVRAFSDGLLRPLHAHDATGRGDLVASLRAWLSRHGQWDAAAADLGVHRHTLRYRMRRVEEILGRSLDDPDVRMELWLALKTTEQPATR